MRQKLIVTGGSRLGGEIILQGAKNAVLPILAGTALCGGEVILKNCPKISDTYAAMRILNSIGCKTSVKLSENTAVIDPAGLNCSDVSEDLMREMRSSIIFLGAILGRCGECNVTFPGGCDIGLRPIDIHIAALKKMGVTITEEYGKLNCIVKHKLKGAKIALSFPSVGATENIMLAAVLAEGITVISNAAREPEIVDLAKFLKKCGAKINGEGSGKIIINGVRELSGCEYSIMPDRIACATYLACAAVAGGEIVVKNCAPADLDSIIPVFEQMGCSIHSIGRSIYFAAKKQLRAVDTIRTTVYPGFPTDAQAFIMAALCKAKGTTVFVENIFENRYKHVGDLKRMGADIRVEGKVAVVEGVSKLYGAKMNSPDLRGGAALVTAALAAEGKSEISDIHFIDRGYEDFEYKLKSLGADIYRTEY